MAQLLLSLKQTGPCWMLQCGRGMVDDVGSDLRCPAGGQWMCTDGSCVSGSPRQLIKSSDPVSFLQRRRSACEHIRHHAPPHPLYLEHVHLAHISHTRVGFAHAQLCSNGFADIWGSAISMVDRARDPPSMAIQLSVHVVPLRFHSMVHLSTLAFSAANSRSEKGSSD